MSFSRPALALLAAVLIITIMGCGAGANSALMMDQKSSSANSLTIPSGNWQITATSTQVSNFTIPVGAYLVQNGSTLSGTVHVFDLECFDPTSDIGITGTISGQNVMLTLTSGSQILSVSASGNGSAISGTYSVTGGCAGGDKGNITANLVPPISGTWKGNFTSALNGNAIGVSGTLSQSGPDAHGLFRVSGNFVFSGSSCFTSGTITSSFLTGGVVGAAIAANDGSTINFTGNLSDVVAGNNFLGHYTVTGGSCNGDAGAGSVTRQ